MQIVLFITLGLQVFPSELVPIFGIGLAISAFLMIIARPISVWLCLTPFKVPWRERTFIAWVGLRGAVPIVFATYPLIAGAEKAGMIFNVVFFISLTSVLLQGTTLAWVASFLGLTVPEELKQRTMTDIALEDRPKSVLRHMDIPQDCPVVGKRLVDLKFPSTATISLIVRDKNYLTPGGATTLEAGDRLFILAEQQEDMDEVMSCLEMNEPGLAG
jgi:cell volume regulation protein A